MNDKQQDESRYNMRQHDNCADCWLPQKSIQDHASFRLERYHLNTTEDIYNLQLAIKEIGQAVMRHNKRIEELEETNGTHNQNLVLLHNRVKELERLVALRDPVSPKGSTIANPAEPEDVSGLPISGKDKPQNSSIIPCHWCGYDGKMWARGKLAGLEEACEIEREWHGLNCSSSCGQLGDMQEKISALKKEMR